MRGSSNHAASASHKGLGDKAFDAAENVVTGLETLFGRAGAVVAKAGDAAGRVGARVVTAGEKIAALAPGPSSPVRITPVIEDGREVFVLAYGGDRCVCETMAFAERIKRALERDAK